MVQLRVHTDAAEFLRVAGEPLLRQEALHNLILGVAARVRDGRSYGDQPPYFLTVRAGDDLLAAAIRTPPFPLILAALGEDRDAIEALAAYLAATDPDLPGVNGPVAAAGVFARAWEELRPARAEPGMQSRIYELRALTPPKQVPGTMRPALEEDVELLAEWTAAFRAEAVPADPPADPREVVRRIMASGTLVVWDNRGPVSMAGSGRRSAHGATVNLVYTPPEQRRHGYASACVAGLSQLLLDRGAAFCTLSADLTNPTSNTIYVRIGYRPIGDRMTYRFAPR